MLRPALQLLVGAVAVATVAFGLQSRLSPPELQLGQLSAAPALPASTFAGTPPPPPSPAASSRPAALASASPPPPPNPASAPVPARPAAGSGSPTAPPASAQQATFILVGGSATVSCSSGGPVLVSATPRAGYHVETGTEDGGATLDVRFKSDSHVSRLDAWCAGGAVQARVEEASS